MKIDFEEILMLVYGADDKDEIQLYLTLNLQKELIIKAMKKVWNKAVDACAESAEIKTIRWQDTNDEQEDYQIVDKESILKNKIK